MSAKIPNGIDKNKIVDVNNSKQSVGKTHKRKPTGSDSFNSSDNISDLDNDIVRPLAKPKPMGGNNQNYDKLQSLNLQDFQHISGYLNVSNDK